MRLNTSVIRGILRRDIHCLLPLILLGLAVFILQPVIANVNLEQEATIWTILQVAFYWVGFFIATLLMVSVLQLDPTVSLNHDWLTRPISRIDWLVAKLLFLFLTVCLPIVVSRFVINFSNDYSLIALLDYATAIEFMPALLATPVLFAIGLLTPTLKRTIFVLVAIFVVFMIPGWDGSRRLLSRIGVDVSSEFGSMMWVQSLSILVLGIFLVITVYWLLYCRRRHVRAWSAFAIGFGLMFFCIFPPAAIYGWDDVIAIHRLMVNRPDTSLEEAVQLEHGLACFPAAPMGTDLGANPLLVQAAWDSEIAAQAGPGALTFATSVNPRSLLGEWMSPTNANVRISVPWRISRLRVRGRLSADSLTGDFALTRSRSSASLQTDMSSDIDYWLIPGHVVNVLANDPSTRLILDYDLALLSPKGYELETDGGRRELSGLGSCRAEIDKNANEIEIDCVKTDSAPALVSAELVGVSGSRVDNFVQPDFAPDWLKSIGRKQYAFTLHSPSLVDSSIVLLKAYSVERILHKRLESPGLIGGPTSICPLPIREPDREILTSNWSDKSSHEVSSIAVESNVRVEVLDWRADELGEKPVLFLIPGLGATAHSYDAIAPKLARRYSVIGMTRRGIGSSSRPDQGYDIERLSQDVLQVLDTLGVDTAILVGMSMGGEELSYLGANHPERVAGLVYLDAAYDRTGNEQLSAPAPTVLLPSRPPPRPSELMSYEALGRYYQRTGDRSPIMPEGEVMALYDLASGAFRPRFDTRYLDAIEMGVEAPDYANISVPALAIYAVPSSPESLMEPWYNRNDPVIRRTIDEVFEWQVRIQSAQIARFRDGVTDSEVLVLYDADHRIIDSNEEEVLNAIDAFIEQL